MARGTLFLNSVAYMETARRILAPGDRLFYRNMGRFAGRQDREHRAFKVMLDDPEKAARLPATLWRTFFDVGRLEVVERGPEGVLLRVHDFPAERSLCERIVGSIEGQQDGLSARAEETACVLRGDPYCRSSSGSGVSAPAQGPGRRGGAAPGSSDRIIWTARVRSSAEMGFRRNITCPNGSAGRGSSLVGSCPLMRTAGLPG